MIQAATGNRVEGKDLTRQEMEDSMNLIMSGDATPAQIGSFITGLRMKGETVDEIAGAWKAIDEIDTVHTGDAMPGGLFENSGTGMDRLKTFNVSSTQLDINI